MTVRLWNVAAGKELLSFQGHEANVLSICFSLDGRVLASGSGDKTILLWDVTLGIGLQALKGRICKWDVMSGTLLRVLEGHTENIYSVCFSPDGKTFAVGSEYNLTHKGHLTLSDTISGKELRTFDGHNSCVVSISFSPDGKTLASGSTDCTLRLWDVASGQCLHILTEFTNSIMRIAWDPTGQWLIAGGLSSVIRQYKLHKISKWIHPFCFGAVMGHRDSIVNGLRSRKCTVYPTIFSGFFSNMHR